MTVILEAQSPIKNNRQLSTNSIPAYLLSIATPSIGAKEFAGLVINAFVPKTIEDCGCLHARKKFNLIRFCLQHVN